MSRLFILVLFALLITNIYACSSHANQKESREVFATDIKPDGSKRFNYALTFQADNKRERGTGKQGRGQAKEGKRGQGKPGRERPQQGAPRSSGQGNSEEQQRENMLARLEQKLEDTAYCRNGFIELDYFALHGQVQIRGECQESASDDDRKMWPNGG